MTAKTGFGRNFKDRGGSSVAFYIYNLTVTRANFAAILGLIFPFEGCEEVHHSGVLTHGSNAVMALGVHVR